MLRALSVFVFICLVSSVGYSQVVPNQGTMAAGTIDLTRPIMDPATGKPLKDESKRDPTYVVIKAFDDHPLGEKIVDRGTILQISGGPNAAFIVSTDPQCKDCPPVTLGWILSEALVTRACPQNLNRGDKKPKECTDELERDEADVFKFTARTNKAQEIRGSDDKPPLQSTTMSAKGIATLRELVAARFKASPQIVWQVWTMIDPAGTPTPPEFGKE